MFLQLNHKNLQVYQSAREMVKECYELTTSFPQQEIYNLTSQIRRAALSVKLNIAEGSSRKSILERKRYFEIARGSVIEIDAAIETAFDLEYLAAHQMELLGLLINKCFALLSGLIK